jgi:hypothetical protein
MVGDANPWIDGPMSLQTDIISYFGLHIPSLRQAKMTHKEGEGPTWKWGGRPTTTILHTMSCITCFLNLQKNAIKRASQTNLSLTKFIVNSINTYVSKWIYYKNILYN